MSGAGTRFMRRGITTSIASVAAATASSASEALPRASHIAASRSKKCAGLRAELQAEDVLELQRRDHRGDAGGEAGGHRVGDELDEPPEAREAHRDQDEPAHRARDEQAREAELRVDRGRGSTMNAAVGPVTCVREPPSAATSVPATIAV